MKKKLILFTLLSFSLNTSAQIGFLIGKVVDKTAFKTTIISKSNNSVFNLGVTYSKDLEKQAKSGDSDAQLDLAICYLQGYGIKRNGSKAYEWLMASAKNNCRAKYCLGLIFEEELVKEQGHLYKNDEAKWRAKDYFKRSANCGNPDAQYKMYELTFRDREQDALEWLNKAASNGNAEALYTIALSTQYNKKKLELLQKSADLGYTPAKEKIIEVIQLVANDDAKSQKYRHICVEKQNSILSVLPIDILPIIDSLTITGILNENDIEVLKECSHLRYLDLSNAYTTLSQELQKKRKANSEFLQGMIQAMGELSQKKYENGEISTVDNLQVQLFTDLVKGSSNVKKASVGCVIPTGSFSGMKNLETIILPVRASVIESKAFQGCPNLKEVILPPYLKEIGTGAFAFCKSMKSIVFPKTLISIGMYDRRHTFGESAAASFVETGIELMDFSNCSFESNAIDNSWSYRFHCKSLKVVGLPNFDSVDVGFGSDSQVICYVPSSVKSIKFYDKSKIKEIHFSSPNPPYVEGGLSNCVIYVPQGSLTNYYAKLKGNGNTIKEEAEFNIEYNYDAKDVSFKGEDIEIFLTK